MNPRPLCVAAHCRSRGRHLPDCPQDDCQGCEPRLADDGLRLCAICTRRVAEDARTAAVLHTDLQLTLIRGGGGGERTSGGATGAPVPDDDVMEARDAIRTTLVSLCRVIAAERGFRLPADDVHAMARSIAASAEWLAAHPAAAEHAGDLRDVAGDGRTWRLAYPSGTDREYLGPCGATWREWTTGGSPPGTNITPGPPCDGDVYRRPGEPTGQCRDCHAEHDAAERIRWLYADVLPSYAFRASEIAYGYDIPAYWIRFQAFTRPEERRNGVVVKPARHARLLPHDHDPQGRPRYLIRDVLDLWAAELARRESSRNQRDQRKGAA